jgi:hypothetical protein
MLNPLLSVTGPPFGEKTRHVGCGSFKRGAIAAAAWSMSWVIATLAAYAPGRTRMVKSRMATFALKMSNQTLAV